jgi:hypothetical protein
MILMHVLACHVALLMLVLWASEHKKALLGAHLGARCGLAGDPSITSMLEASLQR